MTLQEEVNIIYQYIVVGDTLEDAGASEGYSTSEASQMIRDYGFNNDAGQRSGWQSGKDRGRYKPGKPSARGLTVTKTMIREYLKEADEWDWEFDDFVADRAQRYRPPQQPQRQQQPRRPQQPQRQQQPQQPQRPQYQPQWQPQYQPQYQPPQPQRDTEAEKRQAAQLREQGRTALRQNNIRNAYAALKQAHQLNPTWEGDLLLAETCARASDANKHADTIIQLLTEHFDGYSNGKHAMVPTADQYLWRAQAYLNKGDKSRACDDYFRAGDIYYLKDDFSNADRIYTEGREKTGYYSINTPDSAFRVAFARNRGKEVKTKGDYQTCVVFYRKAVENNQQKKYAWGNMSWQLRMLGEYDEAVEAAETAMALGLQEEYVYNNLFWAQLANEEWEDAESTLDSMKYRNYNHVGKRKELYDKWLKDTLLSSEEETLEHIEQIEADGYYVEPWLKGECLRRVADGREAEGIALLKRQLIFYPDHLDALYCLHSAYDQLSDAERLEYCKRYIRAYDSADRSKYYFKEDFLYEAVKDSAKWLEEAEQNRLKQEQEAKAKAEREAKEKAEREAKEKAEQEAKEKAEREAKEKAEREAKEKAEREAKEKAEREAKEKAEREAKEKAEREAKEAERKRKQAEEEILLLLF